MKSRTWLGVCAACAALSAQAIQTAGDLLVDIDVADLSLANNDKVTSWPNTGTLAGVFTNVTAGQGPVFNTIIGGYPSVTFAGSANSVMTNTVTPPASICGTDTWSFETWVFNPALALTEVPFAWTGREVWPGGLNTGSCFEFRFGSDVVNAIEHYGNNVGWGTVPTANAWHYVAGTRDALGVERLFLDGKLWNVVNPPVMRIRTDGSFTLGACRDFRFTNSASAWVNTFSGSMARLRIHDGTLTSPDVVANYLEERSAFNVTVAPDSVWKGASDAALPWADAANWQGGYVPDSAARVNIDNGGTAVVSTAVGSISRFFPYRGGLIMNGAASLTVPAAAGLNVYMGNVASNAFSFTLTEGVFAMPGANNHNLYFANTDARATVTLGGGSLPALLDVDKDIQIGAGARGVARMTLEVGGSMYTSNGYVYVGLAGADAKLTVNGGLIDSRTLAKDLVVANNGARGVLEVNGGKVAPSQNLVWSISGNAATYGAVYINGGEVEAYRLYPSTTTGTNLLFLNGGTIRNRDSRTDFLQSLSAAYVQSGHAVFDIIANTAVTATQPLLADLVSTGGGMVKNGGGSLTLSGTNTFTGNITVNAGDLWLRNANGLVAGYAGTILLNNGASIGYEKAGGVATLMAQLSTASVGSLTLFGANASESVDFTSYPGMALGFHGTVNYTGTFTPYSGQYIFAPMAVGNVYAQTISGAASVTLNGGPAGTLDLNANNSYTGGTTINGGMLSITNLNALGSPSATPDIGIYNGGALKLNNAGIPATIVQRIKADSQGHLILGAACTNLNVDLTGLPGIIVGTDQVTLNYRGTITPAGDLYRTGGGRRAYASDDQGLVVSNLVDGVNPRKLVIEGLGIVRPALGNTYSGGTIITNKGAMHLREDALGAVPAAPAPSNIYVSAGVIRPGDATFTLHANRGLEVGPGGLILETYGTRYMTALGDLSGTGAITNRGTGNVFVGGAGNTWSGFLSVENGTFAVGAGSAFSWNKPNIIYGNGGSFGVNYNGALTWSDAFARPLGDVPASFFVPSGNSVNIGLRKLGTGVLTVDVAPSYTRDTLVESGTLKAGVTNAIPSGSGKGNLNLVNGGLFGPAGTVDVNGLGVYVNGLFGAGTVTDSTASGGQLIVGNNNANGTYFGTVTPGAVLVKTGTGAETLVKGAKVHDLRVNQGTVMLGAEVAATGSVMIAANATLTINTATNEVYGLTGEYFNFDIPELRGLVALTNFVSLGVINTMLAPYAPAQVLSSAPVNWNFDFAASTTNRFQGGYNGRNNFVCRWTGQFFAQAAGVYAFSTASDDGSMVFIDSALVVSNNYFQAYAIPAGKRGGSIALTAGWHDIVVVMYQGSGDRGLTLFMTPPGGSDAPVPQLLLRPYPVKLGNVSGHVAGKLEFLGNRQIVEISPLGNSGFGGRLVSTNTLNALVKLGEGTLTLTNQPAAEFRSPTTVQAGMLALDGSAALGLSPVSLVADGALRVNAYAGTWPNLGLMGSYYNNTGFDANLFSNVNTIATYFNARTPSLVAGTFQTNAAFNALEFNYQSTATPNPFFPTPYNSSKITDFQVLYRGKLLIPEPGTYVLGVNSDDRSDLHLNGVQVITNVTSGSGEKTVAVNLAAGSHDVLLPLQQGTGGYRIYMTVTPPGGTKINMPNAMLRPYASAIGTLSGDTSVDLAHAGSFLRLNQSDASVFAGDITGASGSQIEKNGPQRLTLTGNNDAFLGSWFVSQGELWAGNGATGGTLGGSNVYVSGGAALVFNRSDDIVYAGALAGKGIIRSAGAGRVTLSGEASAFAGTLQIANGQNIYLADTIATNGLISNSGLFGLIGGTSYVDASRIVGPGVIELQDNATLSLGVTEMDLQKELVVSNGVLALAVTNTPSDWQFDRLTLEAGTQLEVVPSGLFGRYCDIPSGDVTGLIISNAFLTLATAEAYFAGKTATLIASTWQQGDVFDFGADTGTAGTALFPGKYRKPAGQLNQYFAAIWKGKIRITEPGTYTFGTYSDDGSMIYIDGATVVNNIGSHAVQLKTGTLSLTAGLHDFVIVYQQGTTGYGLYANITFPGETIPRRLPNAMLVADAADAPAYTLTVDTIAVTNGPGVGTVSFAGPGTLRMTDLWVDTGAKLAVTGGVACAGSTLTVTVPQEVPYGVTVAGNFTATAGLNTEGVTLAAVGTAGKLRYRNKLLYVSRNNGTMMLLR